jgi:hypothetical protein
MGKYMQAQFSRARQATRAAWQYKPRGSTSRAERALSRVITEYFWVYASSRIFRDHEGGPAAWGRRGPADSGCETAPGELASRRSRPPGKSGSWGSTQGSPCPGSPCPGSQRPRGVRARGVRARGVRARGASARGESVPGESVPGESVPGESVPGEPVPGEPVPGEPVSRGASARGRVSTREDTRESASGGEVKAPGRLSCGSPSHGRLLRRSDSRHGGHSRSAKTEGEPHGDRLDGPASPGVRCLPSIRRSPSCGT